MRVLDIGSIALLASVVAGRTCKNVTVPVTVSARNAVFGNLATPIDNFDVTRFVLNLTRQGQNFSAIALTGYATVSGTYNISAQYCTPSGSNATGVTNSSAAATRPLQILTHGIAFDKTYWDIAYNGYNYSYIDAALAAGYNTLSYDRLGIGNSSHGEPKNEIQATLEVAALAEITRMLRNGTFPTVRRSHDPIIHVGHSFGSAQTYALTAMYPNISDAIVLTGFSTNASFMSLFAAGGAMEQAYLNQPLRFGNLSNIQAINRFTQTYWSFTDLLAPVDVTTLKPLNYPPGYMTSGTPGASSYQFLLNGHFDPQILFYAEKGKQPVTVGELLTVASVPRMSSFAGPVLVFTGSDDVPFCGGNCLATGNPAVPSIPSLVGRSLPQAKPFQAYIQPATGHGLTLHYNATAGYQYIQRWLSTNGVGA